MCTQAKTLDDIGVLPTQDALNALIASIDCRATCPHDICHLDELKAISATSGNEALRRFERLVETVAADGAHNQ